MRLKDYQISTLDVLRRFFEAARVAGPKNAYEAITAEPELARRLRQYRGDYVSLDELPGVPYVCLRLPTGGGKTILGTHSIAIARDTWIEKDYPLVLWLVPTKTIRTQTAEALRDASHPYRKVLDEAFDGRVRVFDIADFTQLRPHDIRDNVCIVVGTIQTLRVNEPEGRKVYANNEYMEPHFTAVPQNTVGLERVEDGSTKGSIKLSFANLMHIHRPLMIVDEAHNAVTDLTREMQARINPCAIVEFTATPRTDSNILYNVTAQELKSAEMIKLPVILAEHNSWQNAVNGAVNGRAVLQNAARDDPEYIRPLVLFQAQPKNQEVTVEVLRKYLIEVEQIPENKIAIATGDQRELDGINLFDVKCPIEYVITVEALKEGWDCPFAYVFCSVARIQNADYVEQLLGRVLRMPYAKRRLVPELNRAYAHVSETSFGAAALALCDKLVSMGFEEDEARDAIEPIQGSLDDSGLFTAREKPRPIFRHTVGTTPDLAVVLNEKADKDLAIREVDDGKIEIAVTGRVPPELESAICGAILETERAGFAEAVRKYRIDIKDQLSFAELGASLVVPRLRAEVQGSFEWADTDVFMEFHGWSLFDCPARLTEAEFGVEETARNFEINLDGNRVAYQFAREEEQLLLNVPVEGWTPENLVLWLDRQVRQPDIKQLDLLKWLRDCVSHLIGPRKLHIAALMRAKFILARKLREKIAAYRKGEREKAYQRYLFAPDAKVDVSFENGFAFRDGMYWDEKRYRQGRFRFSKHFLGADNVAAFDGVEAGEEFQCAQAIDSLSQVKYWVRNVSLHSNSFWLPTSTDKFYPDFVAMLEDGRLLVVEYKGALTAETADTEEKRTIGRLWESKSGGKCLFVIVERVIDGKDMRAQLLEKID